MNIYIVKPDLHITDCDDTPTNSTLLSKKTDYLQSKNNCDKFLKTLVQTNPASPDTNSNSSSNTNTDTKTDTNQVSSSINIIQTSSQSSNDNNNTNDKNICSVNPDIASIPRWCIANTDKLDFTNNTDIDSQSMASSISGSYSTCNDEIKPPPTKHFQLQSFSLDSNSYKDSDQIPNNENTLLSYLKIPNGVCLQTHGKWLTLKYLQILSDISLLRYKYLKSYSKLNKIIKKYFSKAVITESDEENGFKEFDIENESFKKLEHTLNLLIAIKKAFENKFQKQINSCMKK